MRALKMNFGGVNNVNVNWNEEVDNFHGLRRGAGTSNVRGPLASHDERRGAGLLIHQPN